MEAEVDEPLGLLGCSGESVTHSAGVESDGAEDLQHLGFGVHDVHYDREAQAIRQLEMAVCNFDLYVHGNRALATRVEAELSDADPTVVREALFDELKFCLAALGFFRDRPWMEATGSPNASSATELYEFATSFRVEVGRDDSAHALVCSLRDDVAAIERLELRVAMRVEQGPTLRT